jgi:hypothetical protein
VINNKRTIIIIIKEINANGVAENFLENIISQCEQQKIVSAAFDYARVINVP